MDQASWLSGKGILLTGAGGALAGDVAEELAAAGARLALVDLREDGLRDRGRQLSAPVIAADLADPADARRAVQLARTALGGVDGVVHTAGAFHWSPVSDTDDSVLDRMLDANLRSLVGVVRAALPDLLARGDGWIAGVSSVQAWRGGAAGVAAYAAAKAGVAAWLRSLDAELVDTAVRVTLLFPMGVIDTPANRADMPDADPADWIPPVELARALRFAAERGPGARLLELPVYPRR